MNSDLLPNRRHRHRNAHHTEGIVAATALAVIAALLGYSIIHAPDFQQQVRRCCSSGLKYLQPFHGFNFTVESKPCNSGHD